MKKVESVDKVGNDESIIKWVTYLSVIIFTVSIILMLLKIKTKGINIGTVLLTLELCYTALSYGTVKIDEVGAMFFLDRPMKNLKKGPYIAFLGILSVKKERGTFFQDELPAEPEKIYRGDDKVPDGMFPPIRIKFGMPREDDTESLKNDPYNVSIVADVVPVVAWRIANPIIFFEKMGTIENCRQILSDKAIAIFGDDLSQMTPAKALLELRKISQTLENELREAILKEKWGIELKDAYLKPFNFSHPLNDAVVNVVKEGEYAKATKIKAAAEKQKRIDEGDGAAYAEEKMLLAKAKGESEIKKLILEVERLNLKKVIKLGETENGKLIIWMETLKKAVENAQYSIIPGSELFTATSGIKEMLEKVKGGIK